MMLVLNALMFLFFVESACSSLAHKSTFLYRLGGILWLFGGTNLVLEQ